EILANKSGILVEDGRHPEPGDITILLRRFTYLGVYEQALRRSIIPHYTVRGRGFYQCQEIWDLINLLFFLAHPEDGPSLLGVLRSPLAGIRDETLTRLAPWDIDGSGPCFLDYFSEAGAAWPESLFAEQVQALDRIKRVLMELRAQAGRFLPAELIETVIEETQYLAVLSAQYQGAQKVANVHRFIEILRRVPLEALYLPRELARYFKARLEETSEDPEAQMTPEGEGAVQIMTIHQAKGLEFPIVFVPEIGSLRVVTRGGPVIFGPENNFGLSLTDPETNQRLEPRDYQLFKQEDRARDVAEHTRLFYVAATRARDYLIFSGNLPPRNRSHENSWRAALDEFAQARPDLVTLNRPREFESAHKIEVDRVEDKVTRLPSPSPEAKEIAARVLDRALPRPAAVAMSATALGSFLLCPRMYYLENELGQPDRNGTASNTASGQGLNPAQTGNIVHGLMETVDLSKPVRFDEMRAKALKEADKTGAEYTSAQIESIAEMVVGFFEHPWGRELLASEKELVKREMPFWLKIEPLDSSEPKMIITGEIDLFYITPQGSARLVDFKYTAWPKPERYQPQLKIYALALAKAGLVKHLEAGLYFTNETGSQTMGLDPGPGWEHDLETEIRGAANELSRIMTSEPTEPEAPIECPFAQCSYKQACQDALDRSE
ncbi:MAG: PD-(D/E)XK nuclease family protein, partial [Deltaproteobacteria bacterium]|nr:PD-(D/E)XK nuclease family protein [Deltaproteobacteria bacterium]